MNSSFFNDNAELKELVEDMLKKEIFTEDLVASYVEKIYPYFQKVQAYNKKFDKDVLDYGKNNSVLKKMKDALAGFRNGKKMKIPKKKLDNNKESTVKLKETMNNGYELVNEVGKFFTDQEIQTDFIIRAQNGDFHRVQKKKMPFKLVFSTYGAGTVSNPFSLAYEISRDMLKQKKTLNDETKINTIQTIIPYILEYHQGKFDSTDAEIYELYENQRETFISSNDYWEIRKTMGGGGGYRTSLEKMGDVGLKQIKYANLFSSKKQTIVFARFSFIRDKLRQLENILNIKNVSEIQSKLISFFVEKNVQLLDLASQGVTKEREANLKKLLKNILTNNQ